VGSIRKSPRNPTRWEARYRDIAGHQRTRTFPSRADAKAWLAETETDIRRGSWIDPTMASTKIGVLAEHWLKATHTKRVGSIVRDRSILNTHILPVLGDRGVGSVTRAEVQQLVNDWAAHAAASTVVRQYACLRALFSYAEECELIPRSPCRNIRVPEAHPRDSLILDDDQITQLGDALGHYRPMLYLALLGLRWGEIAGLRVGDVDFLRGSLTVTRQRTRGEKGRMVEHDPKTRAGRRSLSLPAWMTKMLADHLAQRSLTGDAPDVLLFASPKGEPLHYSNWRRNCWIPARDAAGLGELTFHDLKHTAATLLVEEGVDVKTAQSRLGHANPQTTLRIYAQVTERADRSAADKIGERLRPGQAQAAQTLRASETTVSASLARRRNR
jgi:integrase